ncbi:MAG: hypothetical protein AB2693_32330 [Candidatus Thiodiazotropha sp.]
MPKPESSCPKQHNIQKVVNFVMHIKSSMLICFGMKKCGELLQCKAAHIFSGKMAMFFVQQIPEVNVLLSK